MGKKTLINEQAGEAAKKPRTYPWRLEESKGEGLLGTTPLRGEEERSSRLVFFFFFIRGSKLKRKPRAMAEARAPKRVAEVTRLTSRLFMESRGKNLRPPDGEGDSEWGKNSGKPKEQEKDEKEAGQQNHNFIGLSLCPILSQSGGDGRVGLRRQIKVLVRKGVGSNPTLHTCSLRFLMLFFSFFERKISKGLTFSFASVDSMNSRSFSCLVIPQEPNC